MRILDLSAGARAMWFNKQHPDATFVDIRAEIAPISGNGKPYKTIPADVVCDTRRLPPEVGDGYDIVVFDPPHCSLTRSSKLGRLYGSFSKECIIETIQGTAREAHRVSVKDAMMIFKWAGKGLDDVIKLMAPYWEPLLGQRHVRTCKCGIRGTHWIVLRRAVMDEAA
jgi:hypothetical protein